MSVSLNVDGESLAQYTDRVLQQRRFMGGL
jgi:hypothetical protein